MIDNGNEDDATAAACAAIAQRHEVLAVCQLTDDPQRFAHQLVDVFDRLNVDAHPLEAHALDKLADRNFVSAVESAKQSGALLVVDAPCNANAIGNLKTMLGDRLLLLFVVAKRQTKRAEFKQLVEKIDPAHALVIIK